jgi:hypothetical protein
MATCGKDCDVYSRIVGYFRPIQSWNSGKREEFGDRLEFTEAKGIKNEFQQAVEKPIACECKA